MILVTVIPFNPPSKGETLPSCEEGLRTLSSPKDVSKGAE